MVRVRHEGVIRGGLDYAWQLSETAEFTQDFVVEAGDENTYLESVTALRARILADIALVASYTIKQNTDVPIGSEKTDTFTALSLEYAF
jgi:putative salt-induced outer membrane protein